ncbi:hypothetical protein [Rugosimonospora acidiphila]|uniref:hypothetical protein n=1 Tax=Rugosimonospora acidiphila TaxID=556531 RepID=UPI0031EAB699
MIEPYSYERAAKDNAFRHVGSYLVHPPLPSGLVIRAIAVLLFLSRRAILPLPRRHLGQWCRALRAFDRLLGQRPGSALGASSTASRFGHVDGLVGELATALEVLLYPLDRLSDLRELCRLVLHADAGHLALELSGRVLGGAQELHPFVDLLVSGLELADDLID